MIIVEVIELLNFWKEYLKKTFQTGQIRSGCSGSGGS